MGETFLLNESYVEITRALAGTIAIKGRGKSIKIDVYLKT